MFSGSRCDARSRLDGWQQMGAGNPRWARESDVDGMQKKQTG